jgi:hypothetical protein
MTWPILIPLTAGLTWHGSPVLTKALWVVVLIALIAREMVVELRREAQRPISDKPRSEARGSSNQRGVALDQVHGPDEGGVTIRA